MTDRAAQTRDALLEAAERLFADQGYDAVGVREIVASAGCNLAAIKYHFGSKRELYLETVRRAMERVDSPSTWAILERAPASRRDAAAQLVRFIHRFLENLLGDRSSSACARLMQREAMRPSEAIDDVVAHFTRPHQELVIETVASIAPGLGRRALELAAQSILAQVVHFPMHGAYVERQTELDLDDPRTRAEIADHVARFSMRGLGCSERFLERALANAGETGESPAASGGPGPRRRSP